MSDLRAKLKEESRLFVDIANKFMDGGAVISETYFCAYHLLETAQQQATLIAILLKPLQACDEAMDYMSEYDIPIMLPTQVKEALQAANDAGFLCDTK